MGTRFKNGQQIKERINMSIRDKHPEIQLLDSVGTISIICCTRCNKEERGSYDENEAAGAFYELGWRATEVHTYCPSCAEKYLKTKKK